jgi:hypothetical protein
MTIEKAREYLARYRTPDDETTTSFFGFPLSELTREDLLGVIGYMERQRVEASNRHASLRKTA